MYLHHGVKNCKNHGAKSICAMVLKKKKPFNTGPLIKALRYLEKLKSDKLKSCSIMIQKHFRGWLSRSKYVKIKRLTEMIIRFQVSKMCLFVCFFTVFC